MDCAALAMMCRRRALGLGGGVRDAPLVAATAPWLLVDQDSHTPPMDITHCTSLAVAHDALPIVNAAPAEISSQELAPHSMHSSKLKAALCQSLGGAVPSITATARYLEAFHDDIGKPSAVFPANLNYAAELHSSLWCPTVEPPARIRLHARVKEQLLVVLRESGKTSDISSKVVLTLARVSFREGGPQRRVVVHCALEFLLLQKAGTTTDTDFAKYATQAPIRTARCLPCFRQEPTVGMLRQFRLDDVWPTLTASRSQGRSKASHLRTEAHPGRRGWVRARKTSGRRGAIRRRRTGRRQWR